MARRRSSPGTPTYAARIAEVTCRRCRTAVEVADGSVPLGWSTAGPGTGDGPRDLLCETCTRQHVRDIEAKLDEEWWD